MRSLQQFWASRRMGQDRVSFIRLGPMHLWLARADKEWGYAVEYGDLSQLIDISTVPSDVVPRSLEWVTTVFTDAPMDYALRPAVPDRPLVVRPIHPVRIPPGQAGTFFALIPVFIELLVTAKAQTHVLGKVPTRVMSDTWFGDHARGELSYTLPVPAQRDLAAMETHPHQILCPVEVKNGSKDELFFEKFCIRPRHLNLYCGDQHLWASAVQVSHEGSFHASLVRYDSAAPGYESGMVEVAKAAEKADKRLQWLTFGGAFHGDFITTR